MKFYGVMRVEKRKRQAVSGIEKEANRTREEHENGREFINSEIDWERTEGNEYLIRCDNWMEEIERQISEAGVKTRKDSVMMLDAIYTASPEWFERVSDREKYEYFNDCLAFHDANYGKPFNAVLHKDETTWHLHVASVPLFKDEQGIYHLSAATLMGNIKAYSVRQTEFYEKVSKSRGMERGEQRSPENRRAHLTAQEHKIEENKVTIEELDKQISAQIGEVKALEELKIREAGKDILGRPKDKITVPYKEYQNLVATAKETKNVRRDREELNKREVELTREEESLERRWRYTENWQAELEKKEADIDRALQEKGREMTNFMQQNFVEGRSLMAWFKEEQERERRRLKERDRGEWDLTR